MHQKFSFSAALEPNF